MALILAGCAGAGPGGEPVTAPSVRSAPGDSPAGGTPDGAREPWTIPVDVHLSQTLFRMAAETADGEVTVRLVLRLETPERYRLTLSDRLGRTLYTVDVGPAGGWLSDHRSRRACALPADGGTIVLRGVPLEGFSTAALPAVLLGRVPAEPADAAPARPEEAGSDGELAFRDWEGRRWTVRTDGAEVLAWTLWQGEQPILWWRRDGDRFLLSDRLRGAQLRWQTIARERLGEGLPEPTVPEGFESVECPADEAAAFDTPQGGL